MGIIIIAEAGVNHNGSIDTARELIDAAKSAGADYIKFQTFIPKKLVSEQAEKAGYQKKRTGSQETQLQMLGKLALTFFEFSELEEYCQEKQIGFLSTPFDLDSIDFLDQLGMDFWKLPSGEITNLPYLEKIAKTKKPIVMSTGMCTLEEVEQALMVFRGGKGYKRRDKITILQCNTEYPTPYEDVNLKAMIQMQKRFHCPVGYSDHTLGLAIPIAAVALGAVVIEKHFTLSREMEGPDHAASLEPRELEEMIRSIRQVELAMGTGEKGPSPSEEKNKVAARKSIVAARKITCGEEYTTENITVKRPGGGISPMRWHELLGQTANQEYEEDQPIKE
ncbi:MAG: N-acetylneuraminate synthase [Lachnospiraceae bacterium]